jgi:acetyl-CoA carboxylase biotin carboxylase subunit
MGAMVEKILIANRGEIALRIARACRELGIASVAVYSTADADSAAVRFADEAVQIGPPTVARSYLHIPSIIEAAQKAGADAIHPGYGFLSEDPYFAEICADHGITFIGPTAGVMERMGNKAVARQLMSEAGLPLLPGTIEPVTTADEAQGIADSIGYPVIIKAVAGGGGRGMTVVWRKEDLRHSYQMTRATAQAVFKNNAVYIERYLAASRHTEIQLVCDGHGNGIYLGERDCSVQRRHQKLIEEAPSIHLTPELRATMGSVALKGALSIGYTGAGTMEFLLDDEGQFWFMEMNTRIQVEHPVSEMISGIDLIKEQIRVAGGEPLSHTQDEVRFTGHAIECRINAEDPDRDFTPSAGRLEEFAPPGGPWTRVDSHCFVGWTVSPYYDSLIAKLIVWAPHRGEAINRMARALAEFRVKGPGMKTTIGFHQRVFAHPVFRSGDFHTDFVDRYMTQKLGHRERYSKPASERRPSGPARAVGAGDAVSNHSGFFEYRELLHKTS